MPEIIIVVLCGLIVSSCSKQDAYSIDLYVDEAILDKPSVKAVTFGAMASVKIGSRISINEDGQEELEVFLRDDYVLIIRVVDESSGYFSLIIDNRGGGEFRLLVDLSDKLRFGDRNQENRVLVIRPNETKTISITEADNLN